MTKLCRDITQVELSELFNDAVLFLLVPLSSDLYFLSHRSYLAPRGIVMTGQRAPSLTQEKKPGDEIPGHSHTQALPVLTGRRWVVGLSVPLVILACSVLRQLILQTLSNTQEGTCIRGANCPYAHNVFEYWLHPTR